MSELTLEQKMALARQWENEVGLPSGELLARIKAESNFNDRAISPVGAQGPFQIMPGTAKQWGVVDPFDYESTGPIVARELKKMYTQYGGDPNLVDIAYNAGPGNLKKYGKNIPFKETQNYMRKMNEYRSLYGDSDMDSSTQTVKVPSMDEEPEGKKSFSSKILPLVLRFALPTLAAAAIGKNSFIGAGPAALAGLAAGGLGELGTQANERKTQATLKAARQKQLGDWEIEAAKANLAQGNADRKYELSKSNIESLIEDRNKPDTGSFLPEEKFMEFMKRQLNGRPATEEDRKVFANALFQQKGARKEVDEEGNAQYINPYTDTPGKPAVDGPLWFNTDAVPEYLSPEVTSAIELYNQYVSRGQGGNTSQGFKGVPPWLTKGAQNSEASVVGPGLYKSPDGRTFNARTPEEAQKLQSLGAVRVQ